MNDIMEVVVTERKEKVEDWRGEPYVSVKLEDHGRVMASHETRCHWFPVKDYRFATDFDIDLEVGDVVLLKHVYAGYYAPLTKTDIFGNPFGNCKIANADAIASVYGIKDRNDDRLARSI